MALKPPYTDKDGHCTLEAVEEYEGEHYCLGHLAILQEGAQDLQDFQSSSIYIVTVRYAVRIKARSMQEAQEKAQDMQLPDNYVIDSFEIPDIHDAK